MYFMKITLLVANVISLATLNICPIEERLLSLPCNYSVLFSVFDYVIQQYTFPQWYKYGRRWANKSTVW